MPFCSIAMRSSSVFQLGDGSVDDVVVESLFPSKARSLVLLKNPFEVTVINFDERFFLVLTEPEPRQKYRPVGNVDHLADRHLRQYAHQEFGGDVAVRRCPVRWVTEPGVDVELEPIAQHLKLEGRRHWSEFNGHLVSVDPAAVAIADQFAIVVSVVGGEDAVVWDVAGDAQLLVRWGHAVDHRRGNMMYAGSLGRHRHAGIAQQRLGWIKLPVMRRLVGVVNRHKITPSYLDDVDVRLLAGGLGVDAAV